MGYIGTYGDAHTAPEHHSNTIGTPDWSGKKDTEFDEQLSNSLRGFIQFEAKLQGHNDRVQDRLGENGDFFHKEFLDGWPYRLWQEYYNLGVDQQQGR
ncbi:hypothetical protein [Vibrio parahaemolyticus]|uniref:hypothetical protein n=1 Tax=Vibrio parahaemolyticus TaxID=670 RepID=UPI0023ED63AB|nr:hypothetical protein [Vibrio parahaemolyticus]